MTKQEYAFYYALAKYSIIEAENFRYECEVSLYESLWREQDEREE